MNKIAIVGATIYTPDTHLKNGVILVVDGKIEAVGSVGQIKPAQDYKTIAVNGQIVAPGFIDTQTHGGNGYDFMEATPDQISEILAWMASTGVTGVLPTIATSSLADQLSNIRRIRQVQVQTPPGATILGLHLEGPYISREHHGAQPPAYIRDPSIPEIKEAIEASQNTIRIITLAPELPGALDFIRYIAEQGIIAAVGHSDADYDQFVAAAQAGLSRATHLFNAMTGLHHRQPGVVGAVLTSDDIYAELILDGEHVHPVAAQVAVRAKGINRLMLVSDATQAAGLQDGSYVRPGNRKIIVKNGTARLELGTLAGSVLTIDRAVQNAVKMLGLKLSEAFAIASRVPAESLGLGTSKGRLAPGMDADLVVLSQELEVLLTLVAGRVVYRAPTFVMPMA